MPSVPVSFFVTHIIFCVPYHLLYPASYFVPCIISCTSYNLVYPVSSFVPHIIFCTPYHLLYPVSFFSSATYFFTSCVVAFAYASDMRAGGGRGVTSSSQPIRLYRYARASNNFVKVTLIKGICMDVHHCFVSLFTTCLTLLQT